MVLDAVPPQFLSTPLAWRSSIDLQARIPESRFCQIRTDLHVIFWTFFLNLVFFLKPWPLIVYLYAKWFFSDNLLDLNGHVIDHCPKLQEIWSFNLQDVNVLENSPFFFQSLYLTWLYVFLNGDFENYLFFRHYFLVLPCPSPSPMDIRCKWNKINKSIKPRLIL